MNPNEEIELLETLLDEILAGIQEALQSGQILSDEFQNTLADEIEATTQRIDELRAQAGEQPPTTPPPQAPGIQGLGPAPTPDAQLLWILAGQREEPFVNYLREYPAEGVQELLRNPAELQRVVAYLNAMMPPGSMGQADGIPHADLNSSNVYGFKYDPKTKEMLVRFQGGSIYKYDNIPPYIFNAFSKGQANARTQGSNQWGAWWVNKNPSLGAALNQYIKAGNYPYQRLQ